MMPANDYVSAWGRSRQWISDSFCRHESAFRERAPGSCCSCIYGVPPKHIIHVQWRWGLEREIRPRLSCVWKLSKERKREREAGS